jgi:hypothetical protein
MSEENNLQTPTPASTPTPTPGNTGSLISQGMEKLLGGDSRDNIDKPVSSGKERSEPRPTTEASTTPEKREGKDADPQQPQQQQTQEAPGTTKPVEATTPAPSVEDRLKEFEERLKQTEAEKLKLLKEREIEAERAQDASLRQALHQADANFERQLAPKLELLNDLYAEWHEANEEGDGERAQRLAARWNVIDADIKAQQAQYGQQRQQYQQQYYGYRTQQQLKAVENQLKEEAGVTLQELFEAEPELKKRPNDFFLVNKTSVKVAVAKATAPLKEEIKELKKKLETAEETYRTKWGETSPATIVDGATTGGTGTKDVLAKLQPGATYSLLSEGLNKKLAKRGS